jgi:hypothetical protein
MLQSKRVLLIAMSIEKVVGKWLDKSKCEAARIPPSHRKALAPCICISSPFHPRLLWPMVSEPSHLKLNSDNAIASTAIAMHKWNGRIPQVALERYQTWEHVRFRPLGLGFGELDWIVVGVPNFRF